MTPVPSRPSMKRISSTCQVLNLFDVLGVRRVGAFETCRKRWRRGVLSRRTARGSWWLRHAAELEWLLKDLHAAYQKAVQRAHPDKPGGSHEAAVQVNYAWEKVRRLFAQRGVTLN